MGGAFLLGQLCTGTPTLEAQGGRGPVNNPPPPSPTPPTTGTTGTAAPPVVYTEDSGHTASANGFLAVTGSYGVGTSVLYVIDTVNRQLAVYEARGGATEQRRVVLVGARRIDLDLQIRGYNDRSEYDYEDLKKSFDHRGQKDTDVGTGLKPSTSHK
ncbi:MAG TPA: hypothetical protein VK348_12860 [Planctomycetota bacterium]|nr:hypothetical protein [Planctomycetota bacterium]